MKTKSPCCRGSVKWLDGGLANDMRCLLCGHVFPHEKALYIPESEDSDYWSYQKSIMTKRDKNNE